MGIAPVTSAIQQPVFPPQSEAPEHLSAPGYEALKAEMVKDRDRFYQPRGYDWNKLKDGLVSEEDLKQPMLRFRPTFRDPVLNHQLEVFSRDLSNLVEMSTESTRDTMQAVAKGGFYGSIAGFLISFFGYGINKLGNTKTWQGIGIMTFLGMGLGALMQGVSVGFGHFRNFERSLRQHFQ
ncbi:MAG: hypothetical protein AB7P76_06355 [Candidatus Melainabacteria bacterium]